MSKHPAAQIPEIKIVKLSDIKADSTFNYGRSQEEYDPKHPDMLSLRSSIKAMGRIAEPVILSLDAKGNHHLDAGFRRIVAGKLEGITDTIAIVYKREADDSERRKANALENAKSALTWHGQASLVKAMRERNKWNDDQIAAAMVVTKKHVQQLSRAIDKIDALIAVDGDEDEGLLPADEVMKLGFKDARELASYPKNMVTDAWNAFVKSGRWPAREKLGKGGRKGKGEDALGRKDAMNMLGVAVKWFPWKDLEDHFPPRTAKDVQFLQDLAQDAHARRTADKNYDATRFDNDPATRTFKCRHDANPGTPCYGCGEKGSTAPTSP